MVRIGQAVNIAYQQAVRTIPSIAPIMIGKVIEISIQDRKIANLATGLGLVGSGMYMMATSGVTKLMRRNISSNHRLIRNFYQAKCLALALTGLAATCLGIYMISTSLFQMFYRDPSIVSCELELEQAKREIFSCPEAKKLWKNVQSQGEFNIVCMPASEARSQGRVDVTARTIYLTNHARKGIERETMSDVVAFELSNLNRAKELGQHYDTICKKTPDQWAIEAEKLELKTFAAAQKVIANCKKRGGWTGRFDTAFSSFEEVLREQEQSGHTNAYRLTWISQCAPKLLKETIAWLRMESAQTGKILPTNIDWYDQ